MGDLTKLLEFVHNNGVDVLAIVVFLFLFALLFIRQNKQLKNVTMHNDELFKTVIDFVKNPKGQDPDQFKEDVKRDAEIYGKLSEVRAEFNADIISIYTLHNGQYKKSGAHYNKFSCTHEKRKSHTLPDGIKLYKDMPVSMLWYWNGQLVEHKDLIFPDIERAKEHDMGVYTILHEKGIDSIYTVGLYDIDSNLIGWISMEYMDKKELSEGELCVYKQYVTAINGLFI